MFCTNCGKEVSQNDKFCTNCSKTTLNNNQIGKITINRCQAYACHSLNIDVYIDNVFVGEIPNGGNLEINVRLGKHKIVMFKLSSKLFCPLKTEILLSKENPNVYLDITVEPGYKYTAMKPYIRILKLTKSNATYAETVQNGRIINYNNCNTNNIKYNNYAIISFIISILSLCFFIANVLGFFKEFNLVFSFINIGDIVLGIMALNQIRVLKQKGKKLAIISLVISIFICVSALPLSIFFDIIRSSY